MKSRKQSFTQVSKSHIQFKDIKVWDLLWDLLCSGICSASWCLQETKVCVWSLLFKNIEMFKLIYRKSKPKESLPTLHELSPVTDCTLDESESSNKELNTYTCSMPGSRIFVSKGSASRYIWRFHPIANSLLTNSPLGCWNCVFIEKYDYDFDFDRRVRSRLIAFYRKETS